MNKARNKLCASGLRKPGIPNLALKKKVLCVFGFLLSCSWFVFFNGFYGTSTHFSCSWYSLNSVNRYYLKLSSDLLSSLTTLSSLNSDRSRSFDFYVSLLSTLKFFLINTVTLLYYQQTRYICR